MIEREDLLSGKGKKVRSQDLRAKRLLAAHWSKFALATHDWDAPIIRVAAESARKGMPLLHPLIGEKVNLNETEMFERWWERND